MSKESYKKWAKENPGKAKERWAEWVKANPDKATGRYKKWYYANHEEAKRKKRIAMRRYRAENPGKYRAQSRASKKKLRDKLFKMYGDECASCGFRDKRALTLDHIKNNGAEERAEIGVRGPWYRATKNHLPGEYRILCMNCQFIARVEAKRQNQW